MPKSSGFIFASENALRNATTNFIKPTADKGDNSLFGKVSYAYYLCSLLAPLRLGMKTLPSRFVIRRNKSAGQAPSWP